SRYGVCFHSTCMKEITAYVYVVSLHRYTTYRIIYASTQSRQTRSIPPRDVVSARSASDSKVSAYASAALAENNRIDCAQSIPAKPIIPINIIGRLYRSNR